MQHRLPFSLIGLAFALLCQGSFLGAEIRYAPVQGSSSTYTITADIYRDAADNAALEIQLDFGDGATGTLPRIAHQVLNEGTNCGAVRLSTYQADHEFPGPGTYLLKFNGASRGGGILNLPNSIAQEVCVEALLIINPILGANTSIGFSTPQTHWVQNWNAWAHVPTPQEPDGDSLSFELVAPLGQSCSPIPGYMPIGGTNFTWLDPANGSFLWDYPPLNGLSSLVIRGTEWRNGAMIGQVTRDMSVCVAGFIAGIVPPTRPGLLSLWPTVCADVVNIRNGTDAVLRFELIATNGLIVHAVAVLPGNSMQSVAHLASGLYSANFRDRFGMPVHCERLLKP